MSLFTPPGLRNSARWNNMRVGLLGGSFNPPHKGHVHISQAALRGLKLDAVWWLVTPQNPLKSETPLPLSERLRLSQDITATHPHIVVSALEQDLGTNITYNTIKSIQQRFPKTDFIWISGMDNARSLHTWHHWKDLLRTIPMVHLTRHPAKSLVQNFPLRMNKLQHHVFIDKAAPYPLKAGTTYWMLQKKMVNISSTDIRNKTHKGL